MALWNPHHHHPLMDVQRYPHHVFSLADHLLDGFDSMYEVPSTWLSEMTRDRPLNAGRTTEIVNSDKEFKINLHVEDYKPEELNVKVVRDRFLVVEGKKKEQRESEGDKGFVTGIVANEFTRSFVLPKEVDVQNVRSNLTKEGILMIQVPKVERNAIKHERQIAIEHGGQIAV